MPETLLSMQEAAEITGKSIQTLRRALKTNKIQFKKRKTPQGFNYLIDKESLAAYYKLQASIFDREPAGIKKTSTEVAEYATIADLKRFRKDMESILDEHHKEKENFVRFMKAFQDRFVAMENQLKLLEQPKKSWYHFWKK
jgi:hypothetical protein